VVVLAPSNTASTTCASSSRTTGPRATSRNKRQRSAVRSSVQQSFSLSCNPIAKTCRTAQGAAPGDAGIREASGPEPTTMRRVFLDRPSARERIFSRRCPTLQSS
jgi:hypothetical protein